MAITISVADANKDGTGIDFSAYLKNFAATYESTGYGSFNDPDESNSFKGAGYVTMANDNGDGGTSVIFDSTDGFAYDLSTHVITGALESITFGSDTSYDATTETYSNSSDIVISGFSNYSTSTQDGQVMGDIMDSRITTLTALLASDSIIFQGSTGSDVFTGYSHADTISGGSGNDTLSGAGGKDSISGGSGADKIYGGSNNDTLSGNSGNDTISGGMGGDKIYGGAGNDVLSGNDGNDTISGSSGVDKISGGAGSDNLAAGDGNDTLTGGSGSDTLSGNAGNDRLTGGTGSDILTGGSGADTFYFAKSDGKDTITDFAAGAAGKDVVEFTDGLFKNYADVLDSAKDTTDGVLITYSGGKLLLADVELADLHKSDFHIL